MQTIVTAMSTLTPPCQLACPANQHQISYVLNQVNHKDFEFPSVSCLLFHSWFDSRTQILPPSSQQF